jgi:hypothetical protein
MMAAVADDDVTAQSGGAALLNVPSYLVLLDAETMFAQVPVEISAKDLRHLGPFAVADLRDFRLRLVHGALLWFQGALEAGQTFRRQVQVLDGGLDAGVAKQALQHEDVAALLQLVGGEAVAQGVDALPPSQAGFFFAAS